MVIQWVQQFVLSATPLTWIQVVLQGLALLALYRILKNPHFFWCVLRSLPRDLRAFPTLLALKRDLRYYSSKNWTIFHAFDQIVKKDPLKTLLYFQEEKMSAKELQDLSFRAANFMKKLGIEKGDTVGLFMPNCTQYVPLWLGISRTGGVTALINYNLTLQPLRHCIEAVNCKAIIFSPSLESALRDVLESGPLVGNPKLFYFSNEDNQKNDENMLGENLNERLEEFPATPPLNPSPVGFADKVMYIFTSGTTGLPKASIIKHSRLVLLASSCYHTAQLKPSDILYTSLPLYHGSGTMLGSAVTLIYGVPQVLRNKFSASGFWKDCIKYNVTAAQYIGETCRYLVGQPESQYDIAHKVRVMYGNGLRAEVWTELVKRFNIAKITEVYGSTEGNCGMANLDNRIGAVGFCPIWIQRTLPFCLMKVDEDTGEPLRDPRTGFVQRCGKNEGGELIGKIKKNNPIADFEGYADKSSTEGKILHNAFRKGDSWFRSGDVLLQDELGYFFFKDRSGDTFRWKGENCSTTEVESIIASVCSLGVVVFGVEVPFCDGKAGMAVISDSEGKLEVGKLGEELARSLPLYARPLFLRIVKTELDMTGTYKLRKGDYQKTGFNVNLTEDPLWLLRGGKSYSPLDTPTYEDILQGRIRL